MAGQNVSTEKTLKLVHIVYLLAVVLVAAGVGWGTVTNQQKNNKEQIEKKLNKEVFEVHQQEQRIATNRLQDSLDKGFERLEKRMESK